MMYENQKNFPTIPQYCPVCEAANSYDEHNCILIHTKQHISGIVINRTSSDRMTHIHVA